MSLGKYTPDDARLINEHLDHYLASAQKQLGKLRAVKDKLVRESTKNETEYYRHVVACLKWIRVRPHSIMSDQTIGMFDNADRS